MLTLRHQHIPLDPKILLDAIIGSFVQSKCLKMNLIHSCDLECLGKDWSAFNSII
jgi:hypothetical protein